VKPGSAWRLKSEDDEGDQEDIGTEDPAEERIEVDKVERVIALEPDEASEDTGVGPGEWLRWRRVRAPGIGAGNEFCE